MAATSIKKLFSEHIAKAPFDEKVFRTSCIIFAFTLSIKVLIISVIASVSAWVNVVTLVSFIFYSALFYLSIENKKKLLLAWAFIFYTLSLGVFLWFSTHGWQGSIPVATGLAMLLFASIVPRSQNIWAVVAILTCLASVAFLEYQFPELVTQYPNQRTHFADIWTTIVASILAVATITYFLKLAYEQEQYRLQDRNQRLEDMQEELTTVSKDIFLANAELEATLSELQTAQGQLVQSEKLASLGQLTAGIAHELNNPINFISVNSTVLQEGAQDVLTLLDAYENTIFNHKHLIDTSHIEQVKANVQWLELRNETMNALADLHQGVNRVTEIVKGLQYFSHANMSENEEFDVNESISSSLIILKSKIKAEGIEIKLDLNAETSLIIGFPGQLSQVIINLVINAIDAMEALLIKQLHIQTYNQDSCVIIQVSDTGTGIPEHIRNRIFDPFFTTKPIGKGTGLGLSISYGIIEKHKGTIRVEEGHPQGSIFTIKLPLANS